jgi:putative flavoprotein involved in K+ transport
MTATAETTDRTTVETWLADFDRALTAGDGQAAAQLFVEDSYWRDLIAFTWNIKTSEGREQIAAMLGATLAATQPSTWTITEGEEPTSAGGVTEAWIEFETAVGPGRCSQPSTS